MIIKALTVGGIALLLALRLLRGRFGARLLGVSVRVLNVVYLLALVLAAALAVIFEAWVLLVVVAVLLVLSAVEEIRRRARRRADPPSRARDSVVR
ncbi:hypothetical protein ACFQS2_04685 [Brachybacterium sp. GCM10030267]|uniref:hypothetical protein n=1 Tax=unclassified Brachybacterium TaxID=2623841 RepID=UPI003614F245